MGDSPDFKYVVLDIGDVRYSSKVDGMGFSVVIRKMIEKIRTDMFKAYKKIQEESLGLDFDDPESHKEEVIETPYQLIITTPMYKSSSEFKIHNFTGGDSTIYMADLAFVIQDSNITDKQIVLNESVYKGNIFLVSKHDAYGPGRILEWLNKNDFFSKTKIPENHFYPCRERYEKTPIVKKLKVTHFVDDRAEVLSYMVDEVPNLYLFQSLDEDKEQFIHKIPRPHFVQDWKELLPKLLT